MNKILTLISDWRLRDPYVAMFKGEILTAMPDVNIMDVTHHVDVSDVAQTAFLMKNSYDSFPQGTIHLLLTNTSVNSPFLPVLVQHDGHSFIGEDNGIFTLMFPDMDLSGWQYAGDKQLSAFQKIIQMAKAVSDGTISTMTTEYNKFVRKITEQAYHIPPMKTIEGRITYIDANGNALTNIPAQMFTEAVQKHEFTASIQSKNDWKIQIYHPDYVAEKEMFLTNNSLGCIEITMTNGHVAMLADLQVGDKVIINYD